ncbi:MAG: alpha/beta hydrolase [Chloroflexi bacterium]|nr:alpha/beta hydrolase [Chloroflexota bacterium]
MPLDPQAQALIDAAVGLPATETLTPEEARAGHRERAKLTSGVPQDVAQVRDARIAGPAGEIPIRIYVPEGSAPFPCLVFFHGGGWVTGDLDTHDVLTRALANGAGAVVVAVDYRLAPEHKFPAAIDDAVAATRWVADQATELGIDPSRIAVGGDSAGGNLAAAAALALRHEGGPQLVYQLLIYPVIDYNFDTPSYLENAEGYRLTRAGMQYYWAHYLSEAAHADDHRASPLRAETHTELPPALVITAEYDPLRDEGRAYADRLRDAGVPVIYREYPGMIHGFVTQAGVLDAGRRALDEINENLREAFAASAVAAS